jgi:hypothetical protein
MGVYLRTVVAAIAVIGFPAWCLAAQEPWSSEMLRNNGMQFIIDSGRIIFDGNRIHNTQLSNTSAGNGDKSGRRKDARGKERSSLSEEALSFRNDTGDPSMTYERNNSEEKLSIEITAGDRLRIRRIPQGTSGVLPLEFVQAPTEKLTLTVGGADHQEVHRATSIWHLLIMQPEKCKEHLIPLLELLRSDWDLTNTVSKVEERLLLGVDGDAAAERARWVKWVEDLGDDQFARREAADRSLRAAGPAVLNYLRQLDFNQLDAEQQFRLRRIGSAVSCQATEDSVEQIAVSLAGDPTVWLALLSRPQKAARQMAAQQLMAILGEPIPVDPNADPSSQLAQREELQARIEAR